MADDTICPREGSTIPRILHQTWMAPVGTNDSIPAQLGPLGARWKTALPQWEHRMWRRAENRQLWASAFPELLSMYDGYSHSVQRADAARLAYMWRHGGVYADLDVSPCDVMGATVEALERERQTLLLVREPDATAHLPPRRDSRGRVRPKKLKCTAPASNAGASPSPACPTHCSLSR
jgi:hypothetical protein